MAEATDSSQNHENIMPDSMCADYLDRINTKTRNSDTNSCILYLGRTKKTGYGIIDFKYPGKRFVPVHVHRLRYMIEQKSLHLNPPENHVSHLCHNRICVNIQHLSFEPPSINNSRQNCYSEKRCKQDHFPYPDCILI